MTVLLLLAMAAQAAGRPIMADFTTCGQLGANLYPADTTTWFDAAKNPQITLFAHMLFPLLPGQDAPGPVATAEPWHPPLVLPSQVSPTLQVGDTHYAEAQWIDPEGAVVAQYGLTMPARVSTDYVRLQGRQYIPHTFSMSIGTKDLRSGAGQRATPGKAGQYHIRLYVDGEIEGIAFFRMMTGLVSPLQLSKTAGVPLLETPEAEEGGLNALRAVFQSLTKTGQ